MTADKQIYECECGYRTHFVKALEAHCRFRHHKPKQDEPETIISEVTKEVAKAVRRVKKAETQPEQTEKKTRKPRAKKSAVKE